MRTSGFVALVLTLGLALAWPAITGDDADASVRLSHGAVHVEVSPASRCRSEPCPLVVLVPGFAVPMVVWDSTVPALVEAGFTVLRFDLYGRGRSARPRVDYRPELFAEQLWELVTKLGLPQRFHIVASSMGGAVAAVFAARHPDALDRLVLVGPVGLAHDFPVIVTFLRAPGIGRWYFNSRFQAVMLDHLQDNVEVDVCAYPRVLAEFRRQLEVPGTAEAMFSTFRNTLLADVADDYRQLGRRHRPTLAIWGANDRLVAAETSIERLSQLIPHLSVEKIRGAGHLPQLERPRAFNTAVTRFLSR
jgi:pimeloyl-ACP methyl ester carboxylesterase